MLTRQLLYQLSYIGVFYINLTESVGFEPTELLHPPVFKTGAIDHSATLPDREGSNLTILLPRYTNTMKNTGYKNTA